MKAYSNRILNKFSVASEDYALDYVQYEGKVIAVFDGRGENLYDTYHTLPLLIKYHYNVFKRKMGI